MRAIAQHSLVTYKNGHFFDKFYIKLSLFAVTHERLHKYGRMISLKVTITHFVFNHVSCNHVHV